jgi:hypothetical protein
MLAQSRKSPLRRVRLAADVTCIRTSGATFSEHYTSPWTVA